jgi:hypothetical protein
MEKQPNSRMCFVCGIDNPIGLHLKFYTDDEGPLHRPLSAQTGAPGIPRSTARWDYLYPTGRPNSDSYALLSSAGMTEYYRTPKE